MMPSYLQEESFLEAPFLLIPGEKQILLAAGAGGALLIQEGSGSAWGEPEPIPRRGEKYCAALDNNLRPHLVTLEQGNFYHLILSSGREGSAETLFYREESKSCGHFLFTGDRQGSLHFICLAIDPAAERWWMLHHRYSGDLWEEPRVIDFGSGTAYNYGDIALDANNCLHLVYRIAAANQAGLYYRFFDPGTAHWSKAAPLSTSSAVDYPSIAVDRDQNLHLLWRSIFEGKYYIFYRFKGGPGWKQAGWKTETAISPPLPEPAFPFVSYQSGELFIAWLEGGKLSRYRFCGDRWERMAQQQFEKPLLVRCHSFDLQANSLNYWIAVENIEKTAAGTPSAGAMPAVDSDLDFDFNRLHNFSGKLINRISVLSTDKARLEKEVESRGRQMAVLSQQSEKTMRQLRHNLEGKDAELQKLQEKFDQIIAGMKQKTEQSRQAREAERARYLNELQELKKERRQFEKILQEKEKTIARLEARSREQQYWLEQLREENKALSAKTEAGSWSVKKLWKHLLHKKP